MRLMPDELRQELDTAMALAQTEADIVALETQLVRLRDGGMADAGGLVNLLFYRRLELGLPTAPPGTPVTRVTRVNGELVTTRGTL